MYTLVQKDICQSRLNVVKYKTERSERYWPGPLVAIPLIVFCHSREPFGTIEMHSYRETGEDEEVDDRGLCPLQLLGKLFRRCDAFGE